MQDVLRPFVMAMESKSSKLICLSLVSVQKLVAADVIALDGLLVIIQDMEQVKGGTFSTCPTCTHQQAKDALACTGGKDA